MREHRSRSESPAPLVCALLFLAPSAVAAEAQDLTVSAAVSMKETLEEIARSFESAHEGVEVNLNLGASGDLQRQIEAGASVDVFVSASARSMDVLESRGAVDPHTRRDVACNGLVVVTPARDALELTDLSSLVGARRIALGNPRTVPAGEYAREALRSARLWDRLERRFVYAENVRQVLEYVAREEADAGLVYRTDAAAAGDDVSIAFELDPALHSPIVYPSAVVAGSRRRKLARSFVEFLAGSQARPGLTSHGFLLPPCSR